MILTATPHPATDGRPPFVRIEVTAPEGATFTSLKILRNGVPIRSQPPVAGLSTTYTDDYEAPFGVPVRYTAEGSTTSGPWTTVLAETWANLDGWTTASGSPSVSGGRFRSGTGTSSVSRDLAVGLGAVRITLPSADTLSASTGTARIALGTVAVHRYTQSSGTPPLRLAVGSAESVLPVSSGPVVLLVSADRRTVTLTQDSSRVSLPLNAALSPTMTVSGSLFGSVGPFTVEVPPPPVPVSATVTTVLDEQWPWLIHPANPALSVRIDEPCEWGKCGKTDHLHIDPSTADEVQSEDRRALFVPYGRRETVTFPLGRRPMGSWNLVLNATGLEARNRVMAALTDQAPLLLRMPPRYAEMDLTDGWYSVGAAPVQRLTTDDLRNRRRLLTLEMTRTAIPPVPRVAEFTWGDAFSRGFVWGDLTDYTWFDLLKGEV